MSKTHRTVVQSVLMLLLIPSFVWGQKVEERVKPSKKQVKFTTVRVEQVESNDCLTNDPAALDAVRKYINRIMPYTLAEHFESGDDLTVRFQITSCVPAGSERRGIHRDGSLMTLRIKEAALGMGVSFQGKDGAELANIHVSGDDTYDGEGSVVFRYLLHKAAGKVAEYAARQFGSKQPETNELYPSVHRMVNPADFNGKNVARITVYRPGRFFAKLVTPGVMLNSLHAGLLNNDRYYTFDVVPGEYDFTLTTVVDPGPIRLKVEGGKEYFIRVTTRVGAGGGTWTLSDVPASEALMELKENKMKRIEYGNIIRHRVGEPGDLELPKEFPVKRGGLLGEIK